MTKKKSASSLISELKRKTRRTYGSEEKIRIIIEGMRGEISISELCRKEGINQGNYYKWTKDFMESYKNKIEIVYQHDTYYFNLALWHQFQNQYEAVQVLLQKVSFNDVLQSLHAKRILLKIYYED